MLERVPKSEVPLRVGSCGGRQEPRPRQQLRSVNVLCGRGTGSDAPLINEVLLRILARFVGSASIPLWQVATLSRRREGGSRLCNTEARALIQHGCTSGYSSIRHPSDPYQTPIRHPSDSHQTPIFNDKNDDEGFTGDSWNMTL